MNRDESRNDLGVIKVHKNVISSISAIAATEIEGVKSVANNLRSALFEIAGQKSYSAIKVEISKNEEVKVEIPLIIKYGYNIPEVAGRVQENVRAALEKMSNLSIKDININVRGIERGER